MSVPLNKKQYLLLILIIDGLLKTIVQLLQGGPPLSNEIMNKNILEVNVRGERLTLACRQRPWRAPAEGPRGARTAGQRREHLNLPRGQGQKARNLPKDGPSDRREAASVFTSARSVVHSPAAAAIGSMGTGLPS